MRLEGWESRLFRVVEAARHRPYELGVHDCFRFACEAVQALTGVDLWSQFEGRYRTRREALLLILRHGRTSDEASRWLFGVDPVGALEARRGDVLRYTDPDGEDHFGVCVGTTVAVLGEHGLRFVRRQDCACAWRIG